MKMRKQDMGDGIIIAGGGARGLFFTELLTKDLGRKVSAIAEDNTGGHEVIKMRLKEFGTPDTKICSSIDEALEGIPPSHPPIVFIMTPDWTHLEIFAKAAHLGSHIFLEKPIATTGADVLKLLRIASSTDKTIQVGFVLRYSVFYHKIKEIVDSGVLGKLVMIQMNERLSLIHGAVVCRSWHRKRQYTGGFMNEKCSHDLDLMLWFKEGQAEVSEIFSFGGRHFTPLRETSKQCRSCVLSNCPWRFAGSSTLNTIHGQQFKDASWGELDACVFHSDADIMDHQAVNLRFTDGTQGVFTLATMSGAPGRDIRIFGTDGYLEGNLEKGELLLQNYWKDAKPQKIPLPQTDGHGGGDLAIVAGFLKSVELGEKPLATLEAGARASMVAFAADESVRTGKIITYNSAALKNLSSKGN